MSIQQDSHGSFELLVDIGNSRIKWSTPADLRRGSSVNGACAALTRILEEEWSVLPRPTKVWVASVAKNDVLETVRNWIMEAWGLQAVLAATCPHQLGVTNGYEDPAQLGVDRWLALLGARANTAGASVVVDAGTATTIDSMDTEGRHLGGVILPGIRSMWDSLMRNTAIPQYAVPGDYSLFARNTASGIESAAVMATCCLIKNTVMHLQSRVSTGVSCILTGGAAEQLIPALELEIQHEPNLVLNGLALVAANSTDS